MAIANRFISCARTLKELGAEDTANVLDSIFNNIGVRECLAHAAIYKQPSLIQELYVENLIDKPMGEIGLRLAAEFNAIEVAELLITQYEVSPNAFNYNELLRCGAPHDEHKTPLGIAVEYGHVEMVKFLLQKGASINQPTHLSLSLRDSTPLRVALCEHRYKKGHSKVIELLLKHGADATKITEEYLQKLLENFILPTTSFAKSVTKQNHPIFGPAISSNNTNEANLNDGSNNPLQETSSRLR